MKQSIQLKLGQHLTMTPQLQQAIRLLQLSTLELQHEVQGVLDSNLMLERDEGDSQPETDSAMDAGQEQRDKNEVQASNERNLIASHGTSSCVRGTPWALVATCVPVTPRGVSRAFLKQIARHTR